MKKLALLVLTVCLGGGLTASAQETSKQQIDSLNEALNDLSARVKETELAEKNRSIWKERAKYFNIAYVNQTLTPDIENWEKLGGQELKSDIGAALVMGKSYYLHRKPIVGMIKIGLDWSWVDFNYAQYKVGEEGSEGSEKAHQLEYGMQIGPSVTVNPIHHLKVSAYFRVTPSYSMMYLNEELYHHYATFCNTGLAVAWKMISVGCEWRWGKAAYDGLTVDLDNIGGDYSDEGIDVDTSNVVQDLPNQKLKTKSFRAYISFRF